MFTVLFFIPIFCNEGRKFSPVVHARFEARTVDLFGGISRVPGVVVGAWKHEGRVYHDRTRVYSVAVKSICEGSKIGELAAFARVLYRQEAIFITYLGLAEVLAEL